MIIPSLTNNSCCREPSWLLVNMPREEQKSDVPNVDNYHHRWFFFTLRLRIEPCISAICEINLTESAYVETSAKIDVIRGKTTLIIVDSSHIGTAHANHVVLCNSRVQKVVASVVSLFASKVLSEVKAKTISIWPDAKGASTGNSPKMTLHVIERSLVFRD